MMSSPSWIPLESDQLTATIDPHGAQLSTLRTRGAQDLLWEGDPAVWAGRAPLLFPIVGMLAGGTYRLGSNRYALPRHGFARVRSFVLERSSSGSATFSLRADAATLAVYPFRFEMRVHFELSAATLSITATIFNGGDEDMPASFGYHPGFRWPLPFGQPRTAHFLEFERDEPDPVRHLDNNGLLQPASFATPVTGRRLVLSDELFRNDVIIFDRVKSRALLYGAAQGNQLRIGFPDAAYLGVWTKPGANFVCIEPWHGVTDPVGFNGDFFSKPGVFVLKPQQSQRTTMSISLIVS